MNRNKWLIAGCIALSAGAALWRASVSARITADKVVKRPAPSELVSEAPTPRVAPPALTVRAPTAAAQPAAQAASPKPNNEGDDLWALRLDALDSVPGPSQRKDDDAWLTFQKQPVDAKWADGTKQVITADLSSLSQLAAFKVNSVECRDTMCIATLDFVDAMEAYKRFPEVASHNFNVPCTVSVTDDNPNAPADRSSLRVFFSECAKRS